MKKLILLYVINFITLTNTKDNTPDESTVFILTDAQEKLYEKYKNKLGQWQKDMKEWVAINTKVSDNLNKAIADIAKLKTPIKQKDKDKMILNINAQLKKGKLTESQLEEDSKIYITALTSKRDDILKTKPKKPNNPINKGSIAEK